MISSFSGRCLWILGFSCVCRKQTLRCPCSLMRKVKLEWNQPMRPSPGPCGSRHTLLNFPYLTTWPLLISHLTRKPFITLPCVIMPPRWGHDSLEGKREGATDKKWRRERKEEREMRAWTNDGSESWVWKKMLMSLVFFFYTHKEKILHNIHARYKWLAFFAEV